MSPNADQEPTMPQPFPQPRHRDDTPEITPLIDPDALRTVIVGLDPDRTDSPLRRVLRAVGIGRRTATPTPDTDQETPAP